MKALGYLALCLLGLLALGLAILFAGAKHRLPDEPYTDDDVRTKFLRQQLDLMQNNRR